MVLNHLSAEYFAVLMLQMYGKQKATFSAATEVAQPR